MKKIAATPIIIFSKLLTQVLKLTGRGSGTALPGLIVEKYFPWVFNVLISNFETKIVVTGTNGKTTTQTITRYILDEAEIPVINNSAGANLYRGIIAQLVKSCTIFGEFNAKTLLLEVEEGTLPKIVKKLDPTFIILTNLYRDQLDAYGEVDITQKYLADAVKQSPNSKIIYNADDPRLNQLVQNIPNEKIGVSIPDQFSQNLPYEGESIKNDGNTDLVKAVNIKVNEDLSTTFSIKGKIEIENLKINVPGFFHVYNALSAITLANQFFCHPACPPELVHRREALEGQKKIDTNLVKSALTKFKPAFGRGEKVEVENANNEKFSLQILLIKNPAGFSANLSLINQIQDLKLVLLINDNTADGKDVSWLWDSNIEQLDNTKFDWLMCGGTRGADMHVRLKYAIEDQSKTKDISVYKNISNCLDEIKNRAKANETVFVLPTYTAMLELRKQLGLSIE